VFYIKEHALFSKVGESFGTTFISLQLTLSAIETNVEFWHFRGGVHPQDDVIIKQDLGVLVFTQTLSYSTLGILNFKKGEKMKYPTVII